MILIALGVSMCSTGVHAKQVSGTLIIDKGDFYGWRMDVMIPSQILAEVNATNGSAIDVLVLDEANYTKYLAGSSDFDYYSDYSVLSSSKIALNFSVLSGTVYVIVDNSDRPLIGGADPAGNVEIEYWIGTTFDFGAIPPQHNVWVMYVLAAGTAVLLVAVIVLARKAIRSNKKERKGSTEGPKE